MEKQQAGREGHFLLRWSCFRQNSREMRHCLRFEMGGMEFANLEAETEYSVNCFTSAWKFTQPNRVAVACDAHENAAPIWEIAEF